MKAPNNCKYAIVYVMDLFVVSKHRTGKAVKKAYLKISKGRNLYVISTWNKNTNEYESTNENANWEIEAMEELVRK